ncbi:MAG: PAS domain S-box protein [Gemmataceae bacterium]
MTEPLQFLVVSDDDTLLHGVHAVLARAGLPCEGRRARADDVRAAFASRRYHLCLVEDRVCPLPRPFALASPPDVLLVMLCEPGREFFGAEAMDEGFADYLLKDNLSRLGPLARRWLLRQPPRGGQVLGETDLHRAHAALLQLARSRAFQGDNLIDDLREITEVAARALGVARAGVWLYDQGRSRIRCIDLYEQALDRHSDGEELLFRDHPAYFLALEEQRLIVAHDARRDPRTAEYTARYLEPRGITSMLDAAARTRGELRGVICLEHVGPTRQWTVEEEVFACAFADLVSLALEAAERQVAEFALVQSEARYREVFHNTSDAFAFFEVLGGRRFVLEGLNPAAERLLGVKAGECSGKSLTDLLPAQAAEVVLRAFQRAVESGATCASEQCWDLSPRPRWLHALIVPSCHPGQVPHRLAAVWRDITEQKSYEKALIDREETFRRLVETTHVIPWEADFQTGRFTYVGPQAMRRFGYTHPEWFRDGFWADLIHPEDRARAVEASRRMSAQASEYEIEYRVLTRSGEVVWVHDVISVVLGRQGRVVLRGFFVDVTARRKAEEEARRLNAELESRVAERTAQLAAANRELEAFSYSVSHDLRAPLRAIDGFSKALLEDYPDALDADGRDMLHRLRAASQRMGVLIDDLLGLSRVTRSEMRAARVNLSEMASLVAGALAQTAPQRQVEWVIAPDLVAVGDPALLRVVFENLLGNAWKYTAKRPSARIEFGQLPGGPDAEYFVRDDGVGFDPAHADKLFQPFQRLHHADEFEGHGIGLATVQRIIHRHRGRVRAEAEPGRGATFYFTL